MGIKLSDFIKDPHNVFTQEEAEMIYLAAGYADLVNKYPGHIEALYELVNKLEEENKRLREALEFYANEKSWMNREVTILMDGEPTDVEDCPAIFDDGGNIARKALEGEENDG